MTSRSERLELNRKRLRRRITLSAAAVGATFAAVFGLVVAGSGSQVAAAPASGGYFQLLPPGAALPTGAECAARVHRSPWEPRPDNYKANHTVPVVNLAKHSAFNAAWNSTYEPRVTGNFTGTTDEIIQWAACKWGWSDELVRAQAVIESTWRQSTVGDGDTSYGLMQIRYLYHPRVNGGCKDCAGTSWPNSANSTAFNVDLFLAEMRGCYDGMSSYLGNTRGDEFGCIGSWYSGSWLTSSSLSYISKVHGALNSKAWLSWPDQSASLPAASAQPQAPAPTTARTPAAPHAAAAKPRPTTTTAPKATTKPAPKPAAKPAASPTTVRKRPTARKPENPHLAELRKLRKELDAYCKAKGC